MQPSFNPADLTATEEIEALLPWFVTGRLTAVERRLVATRMEENPVFSAQVVLAIAERDATVSANEQELPTSTAGPDHLMMALSTVPQSVRWNDTRLSILWRKWADAVAALPPRSMGLAASAAGGN